MNYRRLEQDHTARLFQAYFIEKHFGFVICGSIAASVSPFVATIRHWRSGPAPSPLGRPFQPGMTADFRFAAARRTKASKAIRLSHQLESLQASMPVLTDDDVVVHGDAERARHLDDRLRHLHVHARRGRIAAGVIVHHPTPPTIAPILFDF
jgi:hypothetical protein